MVSLWITIQGAVTTPGIDSSVGRASPKRGSGGLLIASTAILLALAAVAHASVSSISPASGETMPGGTATATIRVDSGILTTCLTATSSNPATVIVTLDGLATVCGTGTWSSNMEVTVSSLATPGSYTVTVSEVDLLGSLLQSHIWPLNVVAPATTTTLLPDPTITLLPASTTTTTIAAATTTPTVATTLTPTTTSAPNTVPEEPADDQSAGGSSGPTTSSTRPEPAASGEGGAVAAGRPSEVRDREPFSEIAVSSGLIDLVDRALPPVFAQAVASPLVILEVLLRALGRTTAGLVVPLALTVALALGLARRLRRDAEGLPDLDDRLEIPVEGNGEES